MSPDDRKILIGIAIALIAIGTVVVAWRLLVVRQFALDETTHEVKIHVPAIGRAIAATYEREDPSGARGKACRSAKPVPPSIPAKSGYFLQDGPSVDFHSGDTLAGWACMNVSIHGRIFYQYEYRMGGDYKGPPRGGPDPGPNGFEISAEGDLDGDGVTGLYVQTGTFDQSAHEVRFDEGRWLTDDDE